MLYGEEFRSYKNKVGDILYVSVLKFNSSPTIRERHGTERGKTTVLNFVFTFVISALETEIEAPPCAGAWHCEFSEFHARLRFKVIACFNIKQNKSKQHQQKQSWKDSSQTSRYGSENKRSCCCYRGLWLPAIDLNCL